MTKNRKKEKPETNYIREYYDAIQAGTVTVGQYIKDIYGILWMAWIPGNGNLIRAKQTRQ